MNHFAADLKKNNNIQGAVEETFSLFSLREEHELGENSLPPLALIFLPTVRKARLRLRFWLWPRPHQH